jgi:hypothetical protein
VHRRDGARRPVGEKQRHAVSRSYCDRDIRLVGDQHIGRCRLLWKRGATTDDRDRRAVHLREGNDAINANGARQRLVIGG